MILTYNTHHLPILLLQHSLRLAPQLARKCHELRAAALSSPAVREVHLSLAQAAKDGLVDARSSLEEVRTRSNAIIEEHQEWTDKLEQFLNSFARLSVVKAQLVSVEKCRGVADAYAQVLYLLNVRMRGDSLVDVQTITKNIELLIEKVNAVRDKNASPLLSDNPEGNSRITSAVEKRAVDAVLKARAALVNVLDNEFRQFGWPMKVPKPGEDDKLIGNVKIYADQLNHLQRVSNDGDFIFEQTKWHRALSDNWSVAAILRAPLARFRYHFLENSRAHPETASTEDHSENLDGSTSRFDRPEWAAEFALERIRETTPFLSEIRIDGPHTADVKFAEGFCRVFAEKIVYDCELALRMATNDSGADLHIAHASETANQFDSKLRLGILSLRNKNADGPLFQSSLHVLSLNESFLTAWASSELRLADAQVHRLLLRILGKSRSDSVSGVDSYENVASSKEELEQLCSKIVGHIGAASQKCRDLESGERISTFLKLTEIPLLQALRARLKDDVEAMDLEEISVDDIRRCARAALCAQILSNMFEDRAVDALYVAQEERLGRGFYEEDITRLRALYSSTCSLLSDSIASAFVDKVRGGYGYNTRFGEVWTPDAAFVLTHDLSEPLAEPLTILEKSLNAISQGVPCRRAASLIWRPIASKLDHFIFDEVVLQSFIGGTRNAMPAASEQNGFLTTDLCARMARQIAFDVETFVSAFTVVSSNPSQFLPFSAECVSILRIASNKILLPPSNARQDDEELLELIQSVAETADDEAAVKTVEKALQSKLSAVHICPRDALELMAISGHHTAIRLT